MLVATPERALDLAQGGHLRLGTLSGFVLDATDRMLETDASDAVRRIVGMLPEGRQGLLFGTTLPAAVTALSASLLRDPVLVEIAPDHGRTPCCRDRQNERAA